jgi:hypothetical protein
MGNRGRRRLLLAGGHPCGGGSPATIVPTLCTYTAYKNCCNRMRGQRRRSPWARDRRGRGAEVTSAGSGGEESRCSWGEVLPRVPGLLVPTSGFNTELGSQGNGQRRRRNAGGE